jgi:hypothetical protein
MHRILYLLVFNFLFLKIFAQTDSLVLNPDFLSKIEPTIIPRFDETRKSDYILYFPMKYAKFIFTADDKKILESIHDTIVERIDLVYTVFKRDKKFDQVKLNKDRFEMLQNHFPEAFTSNLIEWRLVGQDGSMEYEGANKYFHGFVIYIKPHRVTTADGEIINSVMDRRVDDPSSKILTTNEEIEHVKSVMRALSEPPKTKIIKEKVVRVEEVKEWTGKYLHANPKKRASGKKFKKPGKNRPKEYKIKKIKIDSLIEKEIPDPAYKKDEELISKTISKMTYDSVVFSTLKKNNQYWNDYVFVQDVTGSMYPYLTQTLIYLKENMDSKSFEKFVFFNDGDNKPDGPLGKSGGAYEVMSSNYIDIENKAFQCMAAGRGGKSPENDMEALIHAFTKYPDVKGAVLIADNFSPVRDLVLLKKIVDLKKPVDVIVCGTPQNGDVHIHYLYLAKLTGGNIHTLKATLSELNTKKNGDTFKVGSQIFRMEGNTIKLIEQGKW